MVEKAKLTRENVQASYDFCTDRISEQIRLICISSIAVIWLFIAQIDGAPKLPNPINFRILYFSLGLAILSLISDYVQYLAGYFSDSKILRRFDLSTPDDSIEYDYGSFAYKTRTKMFWLKQITAITSVTVLMIGIGLSLISV